MCNYKSSGTMQQVNSIDLQIVFSEDAKEWDKYLTECLTEAIESISYQLQIVHERIENLQLNKFPEDEFDQLRVPLSTLIIISPDFLSHVQQNDNLRNYFKQLQSDRTLCILCGVKVAELTKKIRENLVRFDSWKCLVAKEQDNEFIYNVIDSICSILHRNKGNFDEIYSPFNFMTSIKPKRLVPNYANEYKNLDSIKVNDEPIRTANKRIKAKFKLTPKKVKKGNNKVFILLDQPIDDGRSVKVTLEFKTPSKSNQKCKQELREIDVKRKNPYTLQFMVADDLLASTKVIRVNLFLEQNGRTNQLGVRLLKCETDRAVIEHLSNCLPILRQSFGLNTIDEVDLELANRFKRIVPIGDLNELLVERTERDAIDQKPIIEDLLTGDLDEPNSNRTDKESKNCVEKSTDQAAKKQLKVKTKNKLEHECPTLLHFAAEHNLREFASSLLELEASSDLCFIKNCHGLTPSLIAKLNGHNEISQLIKKHTQLYTTDQRPDEDPIDLGDQTDYVNMSTVGVPNKNTEPTSDFTSDGSDQSSMDGIDSVDGLILKSKPTVTRCQTMNEYDFIGKTRPIRLGKLIDLDSLSMDSEHSSDRVMLPPKLNKATCPLVNLTEFKQRTEGYEYDIVKTSPRRADLPVNNSVNTDRLSNSFNNKLESCKTNLLDRFDDLRVSSSSSTASQDHRELKSIDALQTFDLTEPQIELLNTAKAFKMGAYTNDELELKFKEWAAKYHYKIDQNNQFDTEQPRMGKRSVSSSHLLSQDMKLESKDSGCSSRSSTIKTCLSNINLNAASSSSKFYQFSLTDWFHQLTAKLKQKTDNHTHKSPKFEKKEKGASPSKAWTKRLSSSNVRKSLFETKDFEKHLRASPKSKNQPILNIQDAKMKSLTLPMRMPVSNKSSSPTAKLRNKLNFKKNSKTNLLNAAESPKSKDKMSDRLIDKLTERSDERLNDKLRDKLADKLSGKLNEKLSKQFNDKVSNLTDKITDNINNNIINNNKNLITGSKSFAYSSLCTESNASRLDESNKIALNRFQEQANHVNSTFEYDRIPFGPPILARKATN